LVYLARQVQLTNRLAQAEALRAMAHKFADVTSAAAASRESCDAFTKVMVDRVGPDQLSPDERMLVGIWYTAPCT
jgi:hypothetical protein